MWTKRTTKLRKHNAQKKIKWTTRTIITTKAKLPKSSILLSYNVIARGLHTDAAIPDIPHPVWSLCTSACDYAIECDTSVHISHWAVAGEHHGGGGGRGTGALVQTWEAAKQTAQCLLILEVEGWDVDKELIRCERHLSNTMPRNQISDTTIWV